MGGRKSVIIKPDVSKQDALDDRLALSFRISTSFKNRYGHDDGHYYRFGDSLKTGLCSFDSSHQYESSKEPEWVSPKLCYSPTPHQNKLSFSEQKDQHNSGLSNRLVVRHSCDDVCKFDESLDMEMDHKRSEFLEDFRKESDDDTQDSISNVLDRMKEKGNFKQLSKDEIIYESKFKFFQTIQLIERNFRAGTM